MATTAPPDLGFTSLAELTPVLTGEAGRKHVLAMTVENKAGVLARVAGLFARRGFNIDTLVVSPIENSDTESSITITVSGAGRPIEHLTKQLHKLINVIRIEDVPLTQGLTRELALFRFDLRQVNAGFWPIVNGFEAKVSDFTERQCTIEVTGPYERIEAFILAIGTSGLIATRRTGELALPPRRQRKPEGTPRRSQKTPPTDGE